MTEEESNVVMPETPVYTSTDKRTQIMTVDPGINGTGWCLWEGGNQWELPIPPIKWGCLNGRRRKDRTWVQVTDELMERFNDVLMQQMPAQVYCEFPQFFDDAGGHMCAAKGDLGKLTFLVGRIAEACATFGIVFTPVVVNTWKGQLPKDVVERRVCKKLGLEKGTIKSHALDAAGIGVWAKLGHV